MADDVEMTGKVFMESPMECPNCEREIKPNHDIYIYYDHDVVQAVTHADGCPE